jgi:cell division protein FtsQ
MSVDAQVRTDPRIRRRRQSVARSKRRRWIIAAASVAGVAVCIWAAFFSPLLSVRHVKVVGAEHTTPSEVADAAGLSTEDNLLLVSTSEIATRSETLPWVRDAEVSRKLPGTVVVRVVERKPAMILTVTSGRWLIDRDGMVLDSLVGGGGDLPVLSGFDPGEIGPGTDLGLPQARAAMRVWRSLPRGLASHVVALFAPTPHRISLSLDISTTVRYGSPGGAAAKNAVLKALLARVASQGNAPAYIDVRVPENPAISTTPAVTVDPSPGASPTVAPSPGAEIVEPSPTTDARESRTRR